MGRLVLIFSALGFVLVDPVVPGVTNPVRAAEQSVAPMRPWAEEAIRQHINQQDFAGELDIDKLTALIDAGQILFTARFTRADGVGRPMATQAIQPTKRKRPPRNGFSRTAGLDANACSSCHNQPVVGGAGDFSVNVFVSEGFSNADFDNTDPQFSNERNTNHLFGAGLIELLAREMSAELQTLRKQALSQARQEGSPVKVSMKTKGVSFGQLLAHPDGSVALDKLEGIDADLVIRPFSQKGVMTSLRQFTINALNHHHGMQATERFGARWTAETDFDEDGTSVEITDGDVTALVAWQATRPTPLQLIPQSVEWQEAMQTGAQLFVDAGCGACHRSSLPLESTVFHDPGPFDTAGTRRPDDDGAGSSYDLAKLPWVQALPRNSEGHLLVPLFGDLKRHVIADGEISTLGNELLAQRFVERNVFMTAELWGVASTDPYGHRGDIGTLDEVIIAHGGDARASRDAYLNLPESGRDAVIAWLSTLVIPAQP